MDESPKTVQVSLGAFACTIDGFDDPARVLRQVLRALGEVGSDVPTGAAVPDRDAVRDRVAAATGVSAEAIAVLPGLLVRHLPDGVAAPEPVPAAAGPVSLFAPTDGSGQPPRGANLFLAGAVEPILASPALDPVPMPEPELPPEIAPEPAVAESAEETVETPMDPEPGPDPDPERAPAPASVADLVAQTGLSDPADLIAASTAWCTLGEGRESAPRRAIMEAFLSLPAGAGTTLGERVKALGGLVRDGRLAMAADGSFSLGSAERDRFADYLAPPS